MKNYPKTVEEILSTLDSQQREITEKLRTLIKNTLSTAEETVKRGSITYVLEDKNLFGYAITKVTQI
jgi:predicted transcriptional regulator